MLYLRAYVASHQRLLKSVHASSPSISLWLAPCYISNLFLYSFCFLLFRENHMFTYTFLSLLSIIDATVGIPPPAPLPGQGTHPQLPGCLSHKFTPSFQEAVTKDRLMCGSKHLPLPWRGKYCNATYAPGCVSHTLCQGAYPMTL